MCNGCTTWLYAGVGFDKIDEVLREALFEEIMAQQGH
jgi:hypothetical protein